tara:strand:+ start:783 stop:1271 length:489 start_codon:yes stop_codon:yes gene_type:complete
MFDIVVAVSNNKGIGFKGTIPWRNKEDMLFFKNLTTKTQDVNKKNAIIMGRVTFESIGKKPLPNRDNFVITKNKYDNVESYFNLDECLNDLIQSKKYESIFVIGGETLYKEAVKHYLCNKIYMNVINVNTICDTFFIYDEDIFKINSMEKISDKVTSFILVK